MRRLFNRVLAPCLAVLCLAASASAATLADVTLPDTYPVEGHSLVLNGIGLRTLTIFNVRIYVAGLYLEQPSHDASAIMASSNPKVILLQFLHSGSKAEVEKEYREGEKNNCGSGGCPASDQADFERLVAAAPAVSPGDTSTYIFTARGVRVLANNRLIGDFANRDLANRLLAGFIGSQPPSQDLRSHLLGLSAQ
jgi:hypothetical protein